ncbi:MAG TPA: right-handed parallel beta-helix repeat-containing protein, partial [Chloroflexota bacterium]|nr:right-handed parallel beta-helix repeat-containing protein [Chloroflexota bacterium]
NALRERVASDLVGWPEGVPQALLHGRLAGRLATNLGFAPDVALWAVETWATALAGATERGTGGARGGASEDSRAVERDDLAPWPLRSDAADAYMACEGSGAPKVVLRVAPAPRGEKGAREFATIGAAVREAPAGARIVVAPGVYVEGIVIDRPLEIVAEGAPGTVVVEARDASCLVMEAGYARVQGLVLRGRTGPDGRTRFAVDVPQGHLLLEDCEITSDALACVAIRGRSAAPVLRRCHVRDGKGSGVFVQGGGTGTLEHCAVAGNALAGIEVGSEGQPTLRHCAILDSRGPGVYVSLGGGGTFEDCTISGNGGAGIEVGWHGAPVLRRCRITRNGLYAVRLYAGGGATLEACDLSENRLGPWDVAPGWVQHNGARASLRSTPSKPPSKPPSNPPSSVSATVARRNGHTSTQDVARGAARGAARGEDGDGDGPADGPPG